MMKRAGRVALVTVLLTIGAVGVAVGIVGWPLESQQSQYLTEEVERGTVSKSVSVSGTLVDDYTYAVSPDADPVLTLRDGQSVGRAVTARGYRTTSLKVKVGDQVDKGDTLAEVKDSNGDKSKVKAPHDGWVRSVSTAKNADASQIATLGVGSRKVSVMVSQYDVGRLKANQNVALTLDANHKTFDGVISSISPTGKTVSGVQKYQVVISTKNVPTGAKINMTVTADIIIKSASNVITVPLAAVTESDDATSVQVLDVDGEVRQQLVNTGLVGDTRVEITKGLTVGDRLVTGVAATSGGNTGFGPPPAGGAAAGGGN